MEIRDVIENLRVDVLSLKLRYASLRSEQDMLEGFLWQLLSHLADHDRVVISFEEPHDVSRETPIGGETDGDPTLF